MLWAVSKWTCLIDTDRKIHVAYLGLITLSPVAEGMLLAVSKWTHSIDTDGQVHSTYLGLITSFPAANLSQNGHV